jgi:hypothetical protein
MWVLAGGRTETLLGGFAGLPGLGDFLRAPFDLELHEAGLLIVLGLLVPVACCQSPWSRQYQGASKRFAAASCGSTWTAACARWTCWSRSYSFCSQANRFSQSRIVPIAEHPHQPCLAFIQLPSVRQLRNLFRYAAPFSKIVEGIAAHGEVSRERAQPESICSTSG